MMLCDFPPWDLVPAVAPVQPMRVLLLTASFGEGHNAAAKGLKMALDARSHLNRSCETHMLDLCAVAYPKINAVARIGYVAAIHHTPRLWKRVFDLFDSDNVLERRLHRLGNLREKLLQTISAFQPDAIVSTFPFYNQVIDLLYPDQQPPFLRFIVVTDSIRVNAAWAKGHSDFYIVPNRLTQAGLMGHGVSQAKILDFGFPVSLKFANCQIHRPLGPPWRIFYLPGGSWRKVEDNIRCLSRLPSVELTISGGRDGRLVKKIRELCATLPAFAPIKVFDWVENMPEVLLGQHLVIGKAGGAMVQECIAAGCPMIVSHLVPGQEEGNVALILQQGIGAVAESVDQLERTLYRSLQNEGVLWRTWHQNLIPIQRPLAAETIARFILGRLRVKRG